MGKLLKELSFISGSWSGEGFVVDFTEPVYSMVFGSIQAATPQGVVVHWETFRFEEKDQNVFLYPAQMGRESGTYLLNKSPELERFVFEPFISTQIPIKEIYFQKVNEELIFGIKGEMDNQSFDKEWQLKKRATLTEDVSIG
ncbi:hypothetical protein [Bacillus sp. Marseille-P3661]|uniref:hypothetical protein n=1 Tax=Bacillus sp. Marseille-P3661 TaxID=1936234 RepID=UPI000C83217A|nr:hypothetical protein [Bacillus sp. Marseille-P3661]